MKRYCFFAVVLLLAVFFALPVSAAGGYLCDEWAYFYISEAVSQNLITAAEASGDLRAPITPQEFSVWLRGGCAYAADRFALYDYLVDEPVFGEFGGDFVTREAAMPYLQEAARHFGIRMDLPLPDERVDFGDVSPAYREAAEALCRAGILRGDEHGDLMPQKALTRQEMLAMCIRLADYCTVYAVSGERRTTSVEHVYIWVNEYWVIFEDEAGNRLRCLPQRGSAVGRSDWGVSNVSLIPYGEKRLLIYSGALAPGGEKGTHVTDWDTGEEYFTLPAGVFSGLTPDGKYLMFERTVSSGETWDFGHEVYSVYDISGTALIPPDSERPVLEAAGYLAPITRGRQLDRPFWAETILKAAGEEGLYAGLAEGWGSGSEYAAVPAEYFGILYARMCAALTERYAALGVSVSFPAYTPTGEFLTREEAAVILAEPARICRMKADFSAPPFPDEAQISDPAKSAAEYLHGMRVFMGDQYGNFRPADRITYAEAAAVCTRILLSVPAYVTPRRIQENLYENANRLIGAWLENAEGEVQVLYRAPLYYPVSWYADDSRNPPESDRTYERVDFCTADGKLYAVCRIPDSIYRRETLYSLCDALSTEEILRITADLDYDYASPQVDDRFEGVSADGKHLIFSSPRYAEASPDSAYTAYSVCDLQGRYTARRLTRDALVSAGYSAP